MKKSNFQGKLKWSKDIFLIEKLQANDYKNTHLQNLNHIK